MRGRWAFQDILCGRSHWRKCLSSLVETFNKHSAQWLSVKTFPVWTLFILNFVITNPSCWSTWSSALYNFLWSLSAFFNLSLHNDPLFLTWTLFFHFHCQFLFFRSLVIWGLLMRKCLAPLVGMAFSTERLSSLSQWVSSSLWLQTPQLFDFTSCYHLLILSLMNVMQSSYMDVWHLFTVNLMVYFICWKNW